MQWIHLRIDLGVEIRLLHELFEHPEKGKVLVKMSLKKLFII